MKKMKLAEKKKFKYLFRIISGKYRFQNMINLPNRIQNENTDNSATRIM